MSRRKKNRSTSTRQRGSLCANGDNNHCSQTQHSNFSWAGTDSASQESPHLLAVKRRPSAQGRSVCLPRANQCQPHDSDTSAQDISKDSSCARVSNMRFGKRLAAEASRKWSGQYVDYKAIKKSIKDDVGNEDANGSCFQKVLLMELRKVSAFYSLKAAELEAKLQGTEADAQLCALRAEIQELIKYVALNYVAVVKSIKKRNRHLRENFGPAVNTSLHALDLLSEEVFFTSPRLAALSTQAEVMMQQMQQSKQSSSESWGSAENASALLEEYQCPICLDTLHNPVVLTCAHRFCWGCLVAHTAAARSSKLSMDSKDKDASPTSYRLLEHIASHEEENQYYNCPVCRKPQVMDMEHQHVDMNLTMFVEGLKAVTVAEEPYSWGIIPPQTPEHTGKLCVLLDLDGTLVSSFTPRRAPRLPTYVRTHLVGVGSKLNPQGVLVVERPGLTEFLEELCRFAEVIIFTAGLEDYAKGIIDAIDPHNQFFAACIYREGTLQTEQYQCVKDMGRLNRRLERTVLVDDTPLAFLHQPDNGVPVLGFRGDPDDRLLMEAVLPLLQSLVAEPDVRTVMKRRFDMGSWFKQHGLPIDKIVADASTAASKECAENSAKRLTCTPTAAVPAVPAKATETAAPADPQPPAASKTSPRARPTKDWLVVMNFDRTMLECNAGERLLEELAPELLPAVVGMGDSVPATDLVPLMNNLAGELQRRGISRDVLLSTLQRIGASELPSGTSSMLKHLKEKQVDTKILSESNSIFISHILAGAKVTNSVTEVVTNPATFERVEEEASSAQLAPSSITSQLGGQNQRSAEYKLAVQARSTSAATQAGECHHRCSFCAGSLCKGIEMQAVCQQGAYRRIAFAGDSVSDVCAALRLSADDVILARSGRPLADYLEKAVVAGSNMAQPRAKLQLWSTQEELDSAIQSLLEGS